MIVRHYGHLVREVAFNARPKQSPRSWRLQPGAVVASTLVLGGRVPRIEVRRAESSLTWPGPGSTLVAPAAHERLMQNDPQKMDDAGP
jgi:hypothetical protein